MNVLFLTLVKFESLSESNIYTDLLREFTKHGHHIYVISPLERREEGETHIVREKNATILRLRIGNIQKTNIIEKGISTVLIEPTYKKAIKKYFSSIKMDMVLYSTPPITLVKAIEFVKKRDGALSYLLLKDIFPQNAVDIGILHASGIKSPIYRYFRNKEKRMYGISDVIGCMSPANAKYVITHNPSADLGVVEVCPNSIDAIDLSVSEEVRRKTRVKYGIPLDKKVFVYGGNLGKPQGIPFVIQCIQACRDLAEAFFLIVGDGTEYNLLSDFIEHYKPDNVKLMKHLPKEDYNLLVGACDAGLVFLDHRFTIPNFPSRLLSYMQAKLPVLAATDTSTDLGRIIESNGFGWWCDSANADMFAHSVERAMGEDLKVVGDRGYSFLKKHYSSEKTYHIIEKHLV